MTYLLQAGSDRTGALDFQMSATDYVPEASRQAWINWWPRQS